QQDQGHHMRTAQETTRKGQACPMLHGKGEKSGRPLLTRDGPSELRRACDQEGGEERVTRTATTPHVDIDPTVCHWLTMVLSPAPRSPAGTAASGRGSPAQRSQRCPRVPLPPRGLRHTPQL